jgi:hypothetical protein
MPPPPFAGCGSELGHRKAGWRPKSRKIRSGVLPPFQVALLDPWLSWLHGVMSLHAACECASRARSHTTLCVWWRRLPPHSSRRELHGARLCLACCRPRRPRRRDRRALHALALLYSMLLIHVPFIRPMTLTGSGLRLYARYDWQPGGRLESGKFESGLLPQFQQQLRALLFCVWFGVLRIASYLWDRYRIRRVRRGIGCCVLRICVLYC